MPALSAGHNLQQRHTPRETEAWGLLRDRMSSCDPTYLGIKATGQVGREGGDGGRGKPGGEVPRGRRQYGPAVPRQGVVQKLVMGAGYGRNDAFWAGVARAQRKGLAFSTWVTCHQPQLALSAPP